MISSPCRRHFDCCFHAIRYFAFDAISPLSPTERKMRGAICVSLSPCRRPPMPNHAAAIRFVRLHLSAAAARRCHYDAPSSSASQSTYGKEAASGGVSGARRHDAPRRERLPSLSATRFTTVHRSFVRMNARDHSRHIYIRETYRLRLPLAFVPHAAHTTPPRQTTTPLMPSMFFFFFFFFFFLRAA